MGELLAHARQFQLLRARPGRLIEGVAVRSGHSMGAGSFEAGDQPVQCRREHVLVRGAGIGAVRSGERDPITAQNGGAAEVSHWLVVHYVDSMV